MAFIDNDISNHPLLRAFADDGLLNDDGMTFVQSRSSPRTRGSTAESRAGQRLEEMDRAAAARRSLEQGNFPAGHGLGEDIPEVTVGGYPDRISISDAMKQSDAARIRLDRMETEGGPFLRVLKRWGMEPGSTYKQASGGVWDALSAMSRGETGSEMTSEDLGDIRRYLIAKRMVKPGWASDRPPGGDVGVTTKLPGMENRSMWGGYRTQDARQQAEYDIMEKLIGEWDPRTNQPTGWGAGKGAFGETFNPRLHQTDPTGKSGVMDKFLELMQGSVPEYLNPADVGTPHARPRSQQKPFPGRRWRTHPDPLGLGPVSPGGQGAGFWP
jgi:hypothetical protein